jgi:hypothetical protein
MYVDKKMNPSEMKFGYDFIGISHQELNSVGCMLCCSGVVSLFVGSFGY